MKTRVRIPARSVQGLLSVARKMQQQHAAEGAQSPLRVLDWPQIETLIDELEKMDATIDTMQRERMRLVEQRSLRQVALAETLRSCRDILVGNYGSDMTKQLGIWGFDVLGTKTGTLESQSTKMSSGVAAPSNVQPTKTEAI